VVVSLQKKQSRFMRLLPLLIDHAYMRGYELTLGDGYRDSRVFGKMGEKKGYGHSSSYHKKRLAIDLNLFKNGTYMSSTEDHRFLGEYWESLDDQCTWGGRWQDGNHYSYGEGR